MLAEGAVPDLEGDRERERIIVSEWERSQALYGHRGARCYAELCYALIRYAGGGSGGSWWGTG